MEFFPLPFKFLSIGICMYDLLGWEETEIKTVSQEAANMYKGMFHDGKTSAYGRKSISLDKIFLHVFLWIPP